MGGIGGRREGMWRGRGYSLHLILLYLMEKREDRKDVFNILVSISLMECFAEPAEPSPSRTCCVGPNLYSLAERYQLAGKIWRRKLNVPTW